MNDDARRAFVTLAALVPAAWLLRPPPRRQATEFHAGYFPNVRLRNQDNEEVRFYDDLIKGKIVVIQLTYAVCTNTCPIVTANLVQVQKLLGGRVGRDIFMYSITLRPEVDTPAVLRECMKMHGVGPGWQFFTGRHADIELIRRRLGLVDPDPVIDADITQHSGMIRIGNEPYERWAACRGMARPEWIAKEIRWLDVPGPGTA